MTRVRGLKDYSTLEESAQWLSTQACGPISIEQLWQDGASGQLTFSVGIPDWQTPGEGELRWFDNESGSRIRNVISDGYVALGLLGVKRLQSGHMASLNNARMLGAGTNLTPDTRQEVSAEHVRIHSGELIRYSEVCKHELGTKKSKDAALDLQADMKPPTNYRHLIQEEAYQHWIRLRAMGCNPSVHSICGDMAKWCIDKNIRGGKGQNPRAGTIRNTILGGSSGWEPPDHSIEQAKKYVAELARTAQTKVAQKQN